ncbi:MAG: GWxTD domain-containing protein [candidate division WOR-3 bacterium]|nr:GWxTD domain-containing protein [candidate division WOR-3 bacterium]
MIVIFLFLSTINVDFEVERDTSLIPYIYVNYRIPYSEIVFYKKDTIYEAEYLNSLIIKKDKEQVGGQTQRKKVSVRDYSKTISHDEFTSGQIKQKLSNGKVKVIFYTWDLNSERRWKREKEIEIIELSPTDIGSIRWLSGPSRSVSSEDTIKIKMSLFNFEGNGVNLSYLFSSETGSILYKTDTVLKGKKKYLAYIKFPGNRFPENRYTFEARLSKIGSGEVHKRTLQFEVQKPFFRSKRFIERVRQLLYIGTSKEINGMLDAPIEERKEFWDEFWRKRDPTSGDEENEVRDEYFRRVDYANARFSGLMDGWRSDRGKVYIILGPPDYIERHPFELWSKAYEIWYYDEKGYQLIFVERYSVGEYELINPSREVL